VSDAGGTSGFGRRTNRKSGTPRQMQYTATRIHKRDLARDGMEVAGERDYGRRLPDDDDGERSHSEHRQKGENSPYRCTGFHCRISDISCKAEAGRRVIPAAIVTRRYPG